MKAILVAPNLGASFAGGGGSSVAANVAQTMLENNIRVSSVALSGYSKQILDELHGTELFAYGNRLSFNHLIKRRFRNRGAYRIASSYATSLMLFGFHYYLSHKIKQVKPDIIWFNDDVPRLCERILKDQYTIQYINFSFKTRLRVRVDEQWENYEERGKSPKNEYGYVPRMAQLLVGEKSLSCDTIIANSSVTNRYIKKTNPDLNPLIIHPPVRIPDYVSAEKKLVQIAAIGAFRPNKRFGDIIRALYLSRKQNLRLIIAGLRDDDNYLNYLRCLVKSLGLQNRVLLITNATTSVISKVLAESSIIVSAARFEPFGIAIVEGMGNGCIPIVFEGKDSGPWIEITKSGKYGYGFKDVEELSMILQNASKDYSKSSRVELRTRALQFSRLKFMNQIKKLFEKGS